MGVESITRTLRGLTAVTLGTLSNYSVTLDVPPRLSL